MRLHRTLLSTKPDAINIFVGLFSYMVLVVLFVLDDQNLTANGHQVFAHGHYWRAFTTQLMHADFNHLGSNTIFFTAFAILLNHYFGFWIFPVLSFLAGGLINLIALKIYDPHITLVGISGVIYFMAAFWMTMFVSIQRQMTPYRRLMISTGVSLILFFPDVFQNNVSYLAHGLGFGLGIVVGISYYFSNKKTIRTSEVWVEKPPTNSALEEYIDELEAWEEEQKKGDHMDAFSKGSTLQ